MDLANEMDRWWGMDEEEEVPPPQPAFIGELPSDKPQQYDPNNPLMYISGSGISANSGFYRTDPKRSPFYHLQGGDSESDKQIIGLISNGMDYFQDLLKSPEQRQKEKEEKEEAEKKKKEQEDGKWSNFLSPFYHLQGEGKDDDTLANMTVRQLIDYGKSLGVKGLDGKTKDFILTKILNHIPAEKKAPAPAPAPEVVDEHAEVRELAYKQLIEAPLVELKSLAKEFKITRIPHKNKETLARELAIKMVDQALEQIKNPPKPRITDPDDDDFEGIEYTREDMQRQRAHQAQQAKAESARLKAIRRAKAKQPPKSRSAEDMYLLAKYGSTMKPRGMGKPTLPPQDALESKKDNPVVEEIIEEPMDDGDIRSYFPNAKIMRYSSLAKMSDIEQLLPKDKSYAFLLYEDSPGSGHWVVVMRYGDTIEFFCSYGSAVDGPLRWYNPKDNAMLGQSKPYLSMLLKKADKKFRTVHNTVPFQSSKHGVATCGAWDVMRVNQLVNHNQDLHEFQSYMEDVKKETGLTYDEIVANYVSKR